MEATTSDLSTHCCLTGLHCSEAAVTNYRQHVKFSTALTRNEKRSWPSTKSRDAALKKPLEEENVITSFPGTARIAKQNTVQQCPATYSKLDYNVLR